MNIAELCLQMDASGASDIFLSVGRAPSARRNGQVEPLTEAGLVTQKDFQEFCREYLPAEIWERLERERDVDLGASLGKAGRFRINLSWQRGRASMAIRRIPSGNLDPQVLRIPKTVMEMAVHPRGLVLVTGATGSGKSTTLACMLNHINGSLRRHIVTVEDPVEYSHEDRLSVIDQREIGSDTKDFASALRHVVRQNPDAIFIGEMRDQETIRTAISAAMTGHFVAATMHTMDAVQTVERIINYFPEDLREQTAYDLSIVLRGIVSQRLLRRKDGEGRVPAFEVLAATPLVQRLLAHRDYNALPDAIRNGYTQGMMDFDHSCLALFREGVVTFEEAARASSSRDQFQLLVQGMETGADTFRTYSSDPDQGISIKKLLRDAIHYRASDLILSVGSPPVVRIDGILRSFQMPTLTPADTEKLLYSILTPRQRADFEQNRELDLALAVHGIGAEGRDNYRFRVNGFFQKGSVATAMRVIPTEIPSPETLGLPPAVLKLANLHQGLVLVTGPTGSGKSTTLAALIKIILAKRACHVITVEDPVEFVHEHGVGLIEQREIHADTHSFANALKYVLRQDPDVILVGEMRDPETIATVLTAAETGHLVFATLHTNDVTQSVDRIIDVFPADRQNQVRTQLAACLEAVVSQRLLPGTDPNGGRVAAFEILLGTIAVRSMIREKKTHQLLGAMETSARDGMITMERALQDLLAAQKITRRTYEDMLPRSVSSLNALPGMR
ncbi:MAG: PilT/PilU family type 4a pilus ATPase [Victivallales bacterium]|nr:PilT/PilU family type 4a pilus ATPase [Victivallales bacterium]